MPLRYHLPFLLLILALSRLPAANLPAGFAEVVVAQGLDPTAMTVAPDGRLFLLEKNGRVLVVKNGELLPDPLLTIAVDNYNERGLSGIALHPDFAANGYFYLYYTVAGAGRNRVSRFTAQGDFADPASETILLDLDPMAGTIHNAGSMAFGTDGKLYVSVGDGANAATAQSLQSLLGKVLRLNDNGTIPADNPFYEQTSGPYRAIWALGLRNSFSLAIQPGTGRIFATEVGNGAWEEVNEIVRGGNYGWPIIEGPLQGQTPPAGYREPAFAYNHGQGCAAVGAAFYNPATPLFPAAYAGQFFFADYCEGYIKYLDPDAPGVAKTFATGINRPLNLVVAPDGTLYYLARAGLGGGSEQDNTSTANGTLWRVFYNGNGLPFVSIDPQSVLVSVGESATFSTAASGVPPLTYQWRKDGVDIAGATGSTYVFENAMLGDSGAVFRCIVSNARGADTTREAVLRVTINRRPEPVILLPTEGATYRGGDTLFFQGGALDEEEGALPPAALRWKIDFHHDAHTHPGLTPTPDITEGRFIIPRTGETSANVWYKIYLTATDAAGLSRTVTRLVYPEKTAFHVRSEPSDLPVYVDGAFAHTPITTSSVVGIARRIEAPTSLYVGDSILVFLQWSDGHPTFVRDFIAPADTLTFTALYQWHPLGSGTGLRGYYYDSAPHDPVFTGGYRFTRVDPKVDFNWGYGSPNTTWLGDDFWLVRWEGFVEALFDDTYTFHVLSDDGIRLWVDDQLVIDQWWPQAPTESSGAIQLQGGTQYPIRLEFFEEAGGAVCQLLWSSGRLSKSVIPTSQLYPELINPVVEIEDLPVLVYPNPAGDYVVVEASSYAPRRVELALVNALGQPIQTWSEELSVGLSRQRLDLSGLPAGTYWVKIKVDGKQTGVVRVVRL